MKALDTTIEKILTKYKLSDKDFNTREKTFQELTELVRRHLDPSIKPLWFGSSRNGLVLNTSDMDITLDVSMIDPVDPTSILDSLGKVVSLAQTRCISSRLPFKSPHCLMRVQP